jgi:CubicO group peptidase (beta-lactamase class C family)
MIKDGMGVTRRDFVVTATTAGLTGLIAPIQGASAAGPVPRRSIRPIDDILRPYLKKYNLPALGAAVVKKGNVVAAGVVGVRRAGTQISAQFNDRFHIGSDTKAMTALLAAIFVEKGKLRWDTTVGKIFPELTGRMTPGLRRVTLDQLLSHTSGLPSDNERFVRLLFDSYRQPGNLDELRYWLVSRWIKEPLANKPGMVFAYSNMGYTMVGAILERVGGKTWEELITERVFAPLGLHSAGFGPQSSLGRIDAPVGHMIQDGKIKPFLAGPNGDNPLILGPAGTVHLSVMDFAKWAGWNAGEGKRGPALVASATLQKLHTPIIKFKRPHAEPGTPATGEYGLGWGKIRLNWCPDGIITHSGSNRKNLAQIFLLPRRDWAMVVMTNVGGKQADRGLRRLRDELYRQFGQG